MIKITKESEPNVLKNNKSFWTNQLMKFVLNGQKIPKTVQNRYNHPEVKNALINETNGKCMYCESFIGHVASEHIEHYKPKAAHKYPELTFEWTNLGLACPVCNSNKKDEFDENCAFVNPYTENPDDFFIAFGFIIYHKPGNSRAELTEKLLDLNRPELIERRKERIDSIIRIIELCAKEPNPTLKKMYKKEIDIETQNDKPYWPSLTDW